jgi:hypothetical protein
MCGALLFWGIWNFGDVLFYGIWNVYVAFRAKKTTELMPQNEKSGVLFLGIFGLARDAQIACWAKENAPKK